MKVLLNICYLVMMVTVATGAITYRKLNAAMRWVLYTVAFSIITELAGSISEYYFASNRLLYALANPVEITLLVMFFLTVIPQKYVRWFSIFGILTISVATFLNAFFFTQNPISSIFFVVLKGVMISILCLIYFYNLFLSDKNFEQPDTKMIILVTGFLFYYSFSAVYFSIFNYQVNHKIQLSSIMRILPFLYVIYGMLQIAILFTFGKIMFEKKAPEHAGHAK